MYQLLFVIHGMGAGARPANDPDWSKEIVDDLRASAKTWKHDKDLVLGTPKAGQVLVVPLTYHQLFDDIRAKWSQQTPNATGWLPLLQQLAFHDPAALAKLPGWATSAESGRMRTMYRRASPSRPSGSTETTSGIDASSTAV